MFDPTNSENWAIKTQILTNSPLKATSTYTYNQEPHYILSCELISLKDSGVREYRITLARHPIHKQAQEWRH